LLNILHAFHLRLKKALQGDGEAVQVWLTDLEVWAIERALLNCCQRVSLVAGPSAKRDGTVQALEQIRVRVSRPLHPFN
jgi:hypothetical protein